MKKLIKNIYVIAITTLLTTSLYAQAGHNHSHEHGNKIIDSHAHDELYIESTRKHSTVCFHEKELEKRKIQRAAKVKIWDLVYVKKILPFWMDMPIVASDKKKFKYAVEWVIQFKNKNAKDEKKKIIYIFVDLYGQVTGANYTGH